MAFKAHGEYIHDTWFFSRVAKLPYRAAWEIIVNSPLAMACQPERLHGAEYPGDGAFYRNQGLVNKGWVVTEVSLCGISAVYNHDGNYYICRCLRKDAEDFLLWLAEGALRYPNDTMLRNLVQDVSLAMGIPDPLEAPTKVIPPVEIV